MLFLTENVRTSTISKSVFQSYGDTITSTFDLLQLQEEIIKMDASNILTEENSEKKSLVKRFIQKIKDIIQETSDRIVTIVRKVKEKLTQRTKEKSTSNNTDNVSSDTKSDLVSLPEGLSAVVKYANTILSDIHKLIGAMNKYNADEIDSTYRQLESKIGAVTDKLEGIKNSSKVVNVSLSEVTSVLDSIAKDAAEVSKITKTLNVDIVEKHGYGSNDGAITRSLILLRKAMSCLDSLQSYTRSHIK